MNCPHCLNHIIQGPKHQELMFEICSSCGMVVLDFGAQRPALYQALEKQIERWDQALKARLETCSASFMPTELAG